MYYYTNGMRFRHKELCQKIIPRLLRRRRRDNKENQACRQTKKPLSPYIQTGNRRHDLQQLQYPHRKCIQHPGRLLRPRRFRKTNSDTTHQTPPYRIGSPWNHKKSRLQIKFLPDNHLTSASLLTVQELPVSAAFRSCLPCPASASSGMACGTARIPVRAV